METLIPSDLPFSLSESDRGSATFVCEPHAEYRPASAKAPTPNYWQRKTDHDYKSRCYYMVTLRKAPMMPVFSNVESKDNDFRHARVNHSPIGAIINKEIHNLSRYYAGVKIFDSVVMPDHVHFLIFISVSNAYHLGNVIAALKARCSKAWRNFLGIPEAEKPPTSAPTTAP